MAISGGNRRFAGGLAQKYGLVGPEPSAFYDFTLGSLSAATLRGVVPTFSRPSTAYAYNSAGLLVPVASGAPAFEWDDGVSLGIRLEGARTNVVLNSYFADGLETNWSTLGASNASFTVIGGGLLGVGSYRGHLEKLNASGSEGTKQSLSGLTTGTDYTLSLYAENLTGSITLAGTFGGLSGGVPADGWDFTTFQPTATSGDLQIYFAAARPQGTVADFGLVQLELGAFASSPITTTTAAVTRAADSMSRTISGLPGTILIRGRRPSGQGSADQVLACYHDGTANERVRFTVQSGSLHVIVTDGGSTTADLNLGAVAVNADFAVAARLAANDFAASLSGGSVATDTSGTLPTVTTCHLGSNEAAANHWFGTAARLAEWPVGLPNATLQSLSAAWAA